ncbi:unnamed protein product [Ilex paraguariensis]|uniref:Uncharacterized protein n=1 Tax=Ilex paraguariensis TaxID=185542 RepID=A0ABC8SEJ7_9AQUA
MGIMEPEAELEHIFSPKLPLFSVPLMHSPQHSEMLTLSPPYSLASVPFRWEEEPGKPRPCTTTAAARIITVHPNKNGNRPKRLKLPPRVLAGAKISKPCSPTTVLDGPDVDKTVFSSTSFRFMTKLEGTFDSSSSSPAETQREQLWTMVLRKRRNKMMRGFQKNRKVKHKDGTGRYFTYSCYGKKKVDGGCFVFPSSMDVADCSEGKNGGTRTKMARIIGNGKFSTLSQTKAQFWASSLFVCAIQHFYSIHSARQYYPKAQEGVYQVFKKAISWSRKLNKHGQVQTLKRKREMGIIGQVAELESMFSPKLPLFSVPHMHSPEHSGMLTLSPLYSLASVPFLWEEEPGKPRLSTTFTSVRPNKSGNKPKSLKLPPMLLVESKIAKTPSRTTVLDSPDVDRTIISSASFRITRKLKGSFHSSSWSPLRFFGSRGLKNPKVKGEDGFGGNFSYLRLGKKQVGGDRDDGESGDGVRMKMERIIRNGSFSTLSQAKSQFLEAIYEVFEMAISWSRRLNKGSYKTSSLFWRRQVHKSARALLYYGAYEQSP